MNSGWHGDGYCDDVNNNEGCFFDGGDCCGSNVNGNQSWIGDGFCDAINYNSACTYDGGDCCLIIRISLTNELVNAGLDFLNGDYETIFKPNYYQQQARSWINGDYAIWYSSGQWCIGPLGAFGQTSLQANWMIAINDFYGLTDDKNEWKYRYGTSWISPTNPHDVQITCVNE